MRFFRRSKSVQEKQPATKTSSTDTQGPPSTRHEKEPERRGLNPAWTAIGAAAIALVSSLITTSVSNNIDVANNRNDFLRDQRLAAYSELINAMSIQDAVMRRAFDEATSNFETTTDIPALNAELESAQQTVVEKNSVVSAVGSSFAVYSASFAVNHRAAFTDFLTPQMGVQLMRNQLSRALIGNANSAIDCYTDETRVYFTGAVRSDLGVIEQRETYREPKCEDYLLLSIDDPQVIGVEGIE